MITAGVAVFVELSFSAAAPNRDLTSRKWISNTHLFAFPVYNGTWKFLLERSRFGSPAQQPVIKGHGPER